MLSPLLIANRGEIACRVIRTARRLGIRTVAVFSDADRDALHVELADEAVRLGPPPASESYLRGDRLIEIARATGARAIHPGYGFLAESASFARLCSDSGVAFVGPPAAAMERLGDKDSAKAVAVAAGVPTVPGYHGGDQGGDRLADEARALGFPLLIKAVAGGGGRGMRTVEEEAAFSDALASARREARAAFGREAVLLERLLVRPRHVEVQVFGDAAGNVVHLFERDCTLQRRHQKIIEEAPAPGLTPGLREALGRAAVALAAAVGYRNAGTVEFLLEPDGRFWFIEMNTRLQVEHPVTEMVTGLDLVEWQLRLAAGECLPRSQGAIELHGHSVEARLCAEDPARGFLPSTGRLTHCRLPQEGADLRVETGVRQGDVVSPFYDSMLAKLVAHGATRDAALDRLAAALDRTEIEGPATNGEFLRDLCDRPEVRRLEIHTTWLDQHVAGPRAERDPSPTTVARAALALLLEGLHARPEAKSPWSDTGGWRLNAPPRRVVRFAHPDREVVVEGDLAACRVEVGAVVFAARAGRGEGRAWAELDGHRHPLDWYQSATELVLLEPGRRFRFGLARPADRAEAGAAGDGRVIALMPGRVAKLLVAVGDAVLTGQVLLVLEAMKMEHALEATVAGRVTRLGVAVGDQVAEGAFLVEIDAVDAGEEGPVR